MTSKIITNLKEKLHLRNYYKTEEKHAFLTWLNNNLKYTNGVLKINENYTNTLTNPADNSTGSDDLKTLITGWFYNRKELIDYWTSQLQNRLEYTNGRLYLDSENTDYVRQSISGFYSYETMYQGNYLYYLEVKLSPACKGQSLVFNENYNIRQVYTNTDSVLKLQFYSRVRVNRVLVYADAENYRGVVYSGASIRLTTTQ